MELMEAIQTRRSIRQYTDQRVDDNLIEQLLEAAALSPSAKNRQPWRFLILRGEEKNHVAAMMSEWFEDPNREIPRYAKSAKYSAKTVRMADVLILVFREYDDVWEVGDILSIGSAIEHMCLRALELGLGTLWIRDTCYTEKEICQYVGVPNLILTCALAVGYPDEQPDPRPRKKVSESMIEYKSTTASASSNNIVNNSASIIK